MATHIYSKNHVDWLSKIHVEAFPTENPCGEVMLDVHDETMQPMHQPFTVHDESTQFMHQPFTVDDLVASLREAVDLFENDCMPCDAGTDEWVWLQTSQMILNQYEEPSQSVRESYDATPEGILSPPPPPSTFHIKMPDFGIETTMITAPSRQLDRSWERNTDDIIFAISVTEQKPMNVDDILFAPIEKEEYC